VVIIGAGFGGMAAARQLEQEPVEVTVVDRNNFHTFLPLIYQVATAGLNVADVAYPVRRVFQRNQHVAFRQGTVTGVDWDAHRVHLDDGGTLDFDFLIVAAGSAPNDFGTPGVAAHGFPLYSLEQAARLRNHVLSRFEEADAHPSRREDGTLTFVVVGGGPTGVEVAGALAELIDLVLARDFHTMDARRARVVLVEATDRLLGPFSARSQRYARRMLTWRGVDLRLGVGVSAVHADRVELTDGAVLPTRTLVWAAGVKANPLAAALGVPTGPGGRITVADDLSIPGHPGAYAVGDIADQRHTKAIAGTDATGVADHPEARLPQLAQVAMQGGRHVAKQIRAGLHEPPARAGQRSRPFRYVDKGMMATIGRRAAVAELPQGLRLTGPLAWVAWLVLHLVYLMGMRNRASVLVNWAWSYLTWDHGPRLIFAGGRDPIFRYAPSDAAGSDPVDNPPTRGAPT